MFAFVFIWGVTGVYLVFPTPFQVVVNHFSKLQIYAPLASLEAPSEQPASSNAQVMLLQVADQTPAAAPSAPPPPRRRRRPPRGSNGDVFLRWFYYLHFGNFADWQGKAAWVALGLMPPFLFITGAIMWWNRVLSREARAARTRREVPGLSTVASQ
jgi:hypothetical protein